MSTFSQHNDKDTTQVHKVWAPRMHRSGHKMYRSGHKMHRSGHKMYRSGHKGPHASHHASTYIG